MKKTRDERKREIVLDFLQTKFEGCELKTETSRYNKTYTVYRVGDTMLLETWMTSSGYRGNFTKQFLKEFAAWFPKVKYKRRVLRDWFFSTYNPTLPEGCTVYVP